VGPVVLSYVVYARKGCALSVNLNFDSAMDGRQAAAPRGAGLRPP
jgi:hypothetical protein